MRFSAKYLIRVAPPALLAVLIFGMMPPDRTSERAPVLERGKLPEKNFDHAPEKPHSQDDYFFRLDQLKHFYRAPGEFSHRLVGKDYGFEALSFFITETHPGGGPNLHKHDVEEAHVLLEGTARYRIGNETFTVTAPYIAKVPAGVPHTFVNAGSEPFRLVAVFASNQPKSERLGTNPLVQIVRPK